MIFPWLSLILLLLLGLIPGFLLLRLLLNRLPWSGDWLEMTFASLTLGLAVTGIVAVFLAEMGWFSLGLLGLSMVLLAAALATAVWRKGILLFSAPVGKMGRGEMVFLLLWLPAMLWLMLRPHQFITGGADAGVYVNLGAHIARSGSLVIHDEGLAELDPVLQDAFLRPVENTSADSYLFPAFFVTDVQAGEIMPQFYPLHPVLQAAVYDVGGVQAILLLPGLWSILGALAIYLTTRQIADWRVAALALVGLSLTAMQVWFARYPTSETLTQYFFWAGMWATLVWLGQRSPARLWAMLAGLSIGMTFLTRIDMLFLLPLLLLLIVWQWRRGEAAWGWFALSFLLTATYSVVHAMWQSQPYFYELYNYAVLSLFRGSVGFGLALLVALLGLGVFAYFYEQMMGLLARFERPLRFILIIFIIALSLYAWFIYPGVAVRSYTDAYSTNSIPILDGQNLVRLSWYLAPLGIALGVAGICLLVWQADWQKSILLLTGIFFVLFYMWRIRNNPVQIYAMRRYVPVVLPLFIIGAAYFMGWLAQFKGKWGKTTAVFLTLLWLGGIIWSARGFVSRVDYAGMPEQVAQLSAQFNPGAVLIFNDAQTIGQGDLIGTPLKYLHGHEVFTLRNPDGVTTAVWDEALRQWQAAGRTVYWIEVADGHVWPLTNWNLTEVAAYSLETTILEARYDRKPTEILNKVWAGTVFEVHIPEDSGQ